MSNKKRILSFAVMMCVLFTFMPLNVCAEENTTSTIYTRLLIDNQNKYDGMTKTYSEGYMPTVANGTADVVFPIVSEGGDILGNTIRASLNLGDAEGSPFVYKNYDKTIPLATVSVNDGAGETDCYMARFILELSSNRINGNYPVVLAVSAKDTAGNDIKCEFTAYVTIADGKNPNESDVQVPVTEPVTDDAPVFAPKVMVSSYELSEDVVSPGDEITAKVTLVNTSNQNMVKNMTISASADSEKMILTSDTDTLYIDSVGAAESFEIEYKYRINSQTPSGQYDINLSMDYADADGNTYTSSGRVKVNVTQKTDVQFDNLLIDKELVVSDKVMAKVNVMNLGRSKVYNVRAVVEADGIVPDGTIFIGDVEAGTSASGSVQVAVTSLSTTALYGETSGTVTYYYEDEAGEEYSEEKAFKVTILSPFSDDQTEVTPDDTNQWWIIIGVAGVIIAAFVVLYIVRRIIAKRAEDDDCD